MAKIARRSVASKSPSLSPKSSSLVSSSSPSSSSLPTATLISKNTKSNSHEKSIISVNNRTAINPASSLSVNSIGGEKSLANSANLRNSHYQYAKRAVSVNSKYNNNSHNNESLQSAKSSSNNGSRSLNVTNSNNGTRAKTTTTTETSAINREFNITSPDELSPAERERIRMEFYATYDVMTGVRIAATLGGFFGLMVFLIVYKSRSHSNETLKVLKDPKIAAVAAACMQEEEEREIQQAMEATGLSIFPDEYDNMLFRRQRMLSIGNVSAPPILHRGFRFSSIGGGGYSSLLEPPRRYSLSYSSTRRKSASESSRILSAYPMGSSFGTDDYFIETDDELENDYDNSNQRKSKNGAFRNDQIEENDESQDLRQPSEFLGVPPVGQESRRSSAMTCCSTESSYLERRCSALTLGLSSTYDDVEKSLPKKRNSSTDTWDYYYPDIQVIQPTPKTSPCPSEHSLHRDVLQGRTIPSSSSTNIPGKSIEIIDVGKLVMRKETEIPSAGASSTVVHTDHSFGDLNKKSFTNSQSRTPNYNREELNFDSRTKIDVGCTEKYADSNELKLVVKRKISDPSNLNNNNSYSNVYNTANSNYVSNNTNSNINSCTNNNYQGNTIRRAPLASISSFKISSIDYQDTDLRSVGSDSVFVESYADTDDDMEQFSTDSDELSIGGEDELELSSSKLTVTSRKDYTKPKTIKISSVSISESGITPTATTSVSTVTSLLQHHSSVPTTVQKPLSNSSMASKNDFGYSRKAEELRKFSSSFSKRTRKSFLERHRTMSASSTDRVMLISQQSQDQCSMEQETGRPFSYCGSTSLTPPSTTIFSNLTFRNANENNKSKNDLLKGTKTNGKETSLNTIISIPGPSRGPMEFTEMEKLVTSRSDSKLNRYDKSPSILNEASNSSSTHYSNIKSNLSNENIGKYTNDNEYRRKSNDDSTLIQNRGDKDLLLETDRSSKKQDEYFDMRIITEQHRPSLTSPSVILELPVINLPSQDNNARKVSIGDEDDNDPPRDPSLPGTSRKWSKETLF